MSVSPKKLTIFFSRSKRKRSNDGIPVHASQQPASKKSKRTTSDPITMTDDDIKDMLEMSENRVILLKGIDPLFSSQKHTTFLREQNCSKLLLFLHCIYFFQKLLCEWKPCMAKIFLLQLFETAPFMHIYFFFQKLLSEWKSCMANFFTYLYK
jgi:hypothetical protein